MFIRFKKSTHKKTYFPLQTAVLSYFHKRAAEIICKVQPNQRNSRYGLENYDDVGKKCWRHSQHTSFSLKYDRKKNPKQTIADILQLNIEGQIVT